MGNHMLAAKVEEMQDRIDGLEADLESAVKVAFERGAVKWTRLNYPDLYARWIDLYEERYSAGRYLSNSGRSCLAQ